MHRDAYDITIACLRENGEQGWLSAATTPRGPSHWTHEVFATGRPDTALFRAPTAANPFLPVDFQAKLQAQYGDTNFARQELGGEFVQLEGAEFPGEWFTGDIWFDRWPDDLTLKVVALDPSKGSDGRGDDYQAHVLIGVRVEDSKYVLYVDADLQREGVVPMCDRTVSLCRSFAAAGGGRLIDSVIVEENATMGLLPPAFDAACVKAHYMIPYLLPHEPRPESVPHPARRSHTPSLATVKSASATRCETRACLWGNSSRSRWTSTTTGRMGSPQVCVGLRNCLRRAANPARASGTHQPCSNPPRRENNGNDGASTP